MPRGSILLGLALLCAACGSGGAHRPSSAGAQPGSVRALWQSVPEHVGLVSGTSDYSPGLVRVSFLVVRHDARPVYRPRARLLLARSAGARPFRTAIARLEPVGVPSAVTDPGDVTHIFVAHVRVERPGRYWLLAEPEGAHIAALGNLVVGQQSKSPALGSRAIPSHTPTLASTHGNTAALTTREPPDLGLLRFSIAATLAAHRPFVVVFATPKFCTSRTCGPVVDVVEAVRRRFAGRAVRFIHVEIYKRNDPALGTNRFVREWRLPSEPWTFLVGADGRIRAKFEGSLSAAELAAAVRQKLL